MVIADDEKALAIAGIMGGPVFCSSDETTEIFLESAFFAPLAIAGRAAVSDCIRMLHSAMNVAWILSCQYWP